MKGGKLKKNSPWGYSEMWISWALSTEVWCQVPQQSCACTPSCAWLFESSKDIFFPMDAAHDRCDCLLISILFTLYFIILHYILFPCSLFASLLTNAAVRCEFQIHLKELQSQLFSATQNMTKPIRILQGLKKKKKAWAIANLVNNSVDAAVWAVFMKAWQHFLMKKKQKKNST